MPDDSGLSAVMAHAAQAQVTLFAVRDEYLRLHGEVFASGLPLLLRIVHLRKPPDPEKVSSRADSLLTALSPALQQIEKAAELGVSRAHHVLQYGRALEGVLIHLRHLMLETSIAGGAGGVSPATLGVYQMAVADFADIGRTQATTHD